MRLDPTRPQAPPSLPLPTALCCASRSPRLPPSRSAQVDALEDEIGDEVQARLALKTKLEQEAQLRESAQSELAETRERQTRRQHILPEGVQERASLGHAQTPPHTPVPLGYRTCKTRSTWRTTCGRRSPRTSPS